MRSIVDHSSIESSNTNMVSVVKELTPLVASVDRTDVVDSVVGSFLAGSSVHVNLNDGLLNRNDQMVIN